ncbi:hypothetical protein [Paraburkholderia piptadeniae]|uniref:hypothetical protein n=1 Tax=Paraburkholderia piptadeniae TaxID=1701573 RepID=UPI00135A65F8|nr:hypothetical protein [Paraburkholderia piptadeniae]
MLHGCILVKRRVDALLAAGLELVEAVVNAGPGTHKVVCAGALHADPQVLAA